MTNPTGDALKASAAQVHPLNWEKYDDGEIAYFPFGSYLVQWRHDSVYYWSYDSMIHRDGEMKFIDGHAPSLEIGKIAAQADYEARVRASLTPPIDESAAGFSFCFDPTVKLNAGDVVSINVRERTYTHTKAQTGKQPRTAVWRGDERLPIGAVIEILAQDDLDTDVPGRRASWVRYWPEDRDHPVYRSCNECDYEARILAALPVEQAPQPVAWRFRWVYPETGAPTTWSSTVTAEAARQRAEEGYEVRPLYEAPPVESQATEIAEQQRLISIGMVIAAGVVMKAHGDDTVALEILGAAGGDSEATLRAWGVDDYDIDILRPILAAEGSAE